MSYEPCSSGQNCGLQGLEVFNLSSFIVFSNKSVSQSVGRRECAHNPLKQKGCGALPWRSKTLANHLSNL